MDEMINAVKAGRCSDPFAVLGPHQGVVRAFLPGANSVALVSAQDGSVLAQMQSDAGLFFAPLLDGTPYRLRIDWSGVTQETDDPYRFGPLLSDFDIFLIGASRHHTISQCLGAHVVTIDNVLGVRFAVWAPNASSVSVVGDFNTWDGRRHPMRLRFGAGVWELFVPGLLPGCIYKYEIRAAWGETLPLKADPFAWQGEMAPATGSIVANPADVQWTDQEWMARRPERHRDDQAMSIYEVHAGSWMHKDGHVLSWDDLAEKLVPYAVDMGFTHVEFLPIMLHPFGGSWGYQPLGQFAPSPEFGPPEAFARLVDRCHAAGLGVILDWVPAHFPNDAHGLALFDGTYLYEHADPREGVHKDWNTLIYNLGRNEVRGFLFGSALHWLKVFHVDALRVDAVASMLYRDYSREPGQWIPNVHGGRENLEAVSFFQQLSEMVQEVCPGSLLIAEESTAWPGVTMPAKSGGLGFSFKWNMGWMHDTLHYIEEDPINRSWHHGEMTFGMVCVPISGSCGRIPARSFCSWVASSARRGSGTMTPRSTGICWMIRCIAAYNAWCETSTGY
jgi:1,4-alpha-glucan branching enzyme